MPSQAQPHSTTVTLLHLNDIYELDASRAGGTGSMPRALTAVRRQRALAGHSRLLHAGDFLAPSVTSTLFKGRKMIDAMAYFGFDIIGLGNHDFDYGPERLVEMLHSLDVPVLFTNGLDGRTGAPLPWASRWFIEEYDGFRVGYFAVLTPETASMSSPGVTINFSDPQETAREAVAALKALGADAIVAITHMRMNDDRALADAVPGINVIIGGHDHSRASVQRGGTLIVKAGSDATTLGVTRLSLARSAPGAAATVLVTSELIDVAALPPAPDLNKFVESTESEVSTLLDKPIATLSVGVDGRREIVAQNESALANLLTDHFRQAHGADAALLFAGGIRGERIIPPGPLTLKDLMSIQPFADPLVKIRVHGRDIRRNIEHGLRRLGPDNTGFPHPSNIRYSYNPDAEPGQRLLSIELGNAPLEDDKEYNLVIDSHIMQGSDGLDFHPFVLLHTMSEAVNKVPYIASQIEGRTVTPALDGRIICRQALEP